MTYREVSVIEVKEILRLWLAGHSQREVTTLAGADRKTVRRYVLAAQSTGLAREGGPEQLTDELLGAVVGVVRPDRPHGVGAARESLVAHREQIEGWLARDLTLAKVHVLLGRRGVVVPYRTLHRYAVTELGFGRRRPTVRVADGDPGVEVWYFAARLIPDRPRGPATHPRADLDRAILEDMFLYPTHRQTLRSDRRVRGRVGVFHRRLQGDHPRQHEDDHRRFRSARSAFNYTSTPWPALSSSTPRGPAPTRNTRSCLLAVSFFAGEDFRDLADCRERAAAWCAQVAGTRIHGTTCARPGEVFAAEEAPLLGPAPTGAFAIPAYTRPKIAPDRHVEVARALYSVPGELIGQRLLARARRADGEAVAPRPADQGPSPAGTGAAAHRPGGHAMAGAGQRDVRRFGNSAAANPLHRRRSRRSRGRGGSWGGSAGGAHSTQVVKGNVVDTVTGAVYRSPQMIIRDPRVNPVPTTPESPSAILPAASVTMSASIEQTPIPIRTISLSDLTSQHRQYQTLRSAPSTSTASQPSDRSPVAPTSLLSTTTADPGHSTKAPAERSSCKASKNHVNRASQTRSCELPIKLHIKMSRAVQFRPTALTVRPGWLATQPTDLSSTTRLSSFGFR